VPTPRAADRDRIAAELERVREDLADQRRQRDAAAEQAARAAAERDIAPALPPYGQPDHHGRKRRNRSATRITQSRAVRPHPPRA